MSSTISDATRLNALWCFSKFSRLFLLAGICELFEVYLLYVFQAFSDILFSAIVAPERHKLFLSS